MKKFVAGSAILSLLIVGALAGPAVAGKKKKKPKPKPVPVTMYLHGTQPMGEAEIPDAWQSMAWMAMDETEPSGSSSKSIFVTNYVAGPNSNCSGNGLLPVWKGEITGKITGPITLQLHTAASPGAIIDVRLFADASGGCNDAAQPPVAEVTALSVAPGQGVTEVTFEEVADFDAVANLVVQVNSSRLFDIPDPGGALAYPGQVRIFYDSASAPSNIAFSILK